MGSVGTVVMILKIIRFVHRPSVIPFVRGFPIME